MAETDREWIKPTVLLCIYGFFTYVKPSEPFITPFLQGPVKNFTEEEVVNAIYPVWTYSFLALLLPVFLLTDYVKYKPMIVVQSVGYISCWLLLVFAQGVPYMQLMQFCYGIATSLEVAYYSYIYSVVKPERYQQVTSYVRSTTLFGLFIGSLLAQLLVSLANLEYIYLNVISLANVTIGFFLSLVLPMPKKSLFFYATNEQDVMEDTDSRGEPSIVDATQEKETVSTLEMLKMTLWNIWWDMKTCYLNLSLLRWSVWWALSTCGWLLVINYVQNLWETIQPSSHEEIYNGAVESIATVLGALGALSVGYIKINWDNWGEIVLGLCSLVKCGLLMLMYWTENIWLCYSAYVVFIFLYNFVITITQFQIAAGLTTKRFALVFGFNTFAAVALNTVLTIILIDRAGLGLPVNTQFIIYSGYFGVISMVFMGHWIYSKVCVTTSNPGTTERTI